jgi:hypothetical protein
MEAGGGCEPDRLTTPDDESVPDEFDVESDFFAAALPERGTSKATLAACPTFPEPNAPVATPSFPMPIAAAVTDVRAPPTIVPKPQEPAKIPLQIFGDLTTMRMQPII